MKTKIRNCKICHIETAVPETLVDNMSLDFDQKFLTKIIKSTGVKQRYVLKENQSFLNMYKQIGLNTLNALGWSKDSIDGVIVVTQTPEYKVPATSCCIQGELDLNSETFAYDISMGCSGYVYGLYSAMSTISASNGDIKRVLLFAGDAVSTINHAKNRSTGVLFGDAVSCTAIEYNKNMEEIPFVLKTDGKEFDNIIIEDGGLKNKMTCVSFEDYIDENGDINAKCYTKMSGAKVFNFTIDHVVPLVEEVLKYAQIAKNEISNYCLHQANKFMLEYLSSKLEIGEKTPINKIGRAHV